MTKSAKSFIQLTKLQAVLVLLAFVTTILVVGLLAGLVARSCTKATTTGPDKGTLRSEPEPFIEDSPWLHIRLPTHVIPIHYDLSLYPDFYEDSGHFNGNVSIFIRLEQPARYLLVHIKDLVITSCALVNNETGDVIPIKRNFSFPENEFWVTEISGEDELAAGDVVVLTLSFSGPLTDRIVGFYKSTYLNSQTNEISHLATSKFQPTHARKAFPCFDEPSFKSTFTVTLIHRPGYEALSNMPPLSTDNWSDGLLATTFQKSVPMVTYLACFIVSDFLYKENRTKTGVPFRVYATPDKIDQVDYALEVGTAILDYFEDYFDVPYPLPKQDMIGIPDFVSGAMEHWGLITYRESNLLLDPEVASAANRQRVATVISHELAHMWFGNLVTMNWWDDLWLNEGFASFVEYKGVNHVHPEWDMFDQFVTLDTVRSMEMDGSRTSHPIIVDVQHPDEITQVFDAISYSKGASVLRMLEAVLGEENFCRGVQNYIRSNAYKSIVTDDLWNALEKIPGAPRVKSMMDTWTRQMGFPLLTVKLSGSKVKVVQDRFLFDQETDESVETSVHYTSAYGYRWNVPLTYMTSSGTVGQKLMAMDERVFDTGLEVDDDVEWINMNVNHTGYYKVNYPETMWNSLAEQLQTDHLVFSPADRATFIDDIFDLARVKLASYDQALSMASYMKKETHVVPWRVLQENTRFITAMLQTTPSFGVWKKYVRGIASLPLSRIGFDMDPNSTDHLQSMSRSYLVRLACEHGCNMCLGNISKLFNNWLAGESIHPDIRQSVYRYGLQASRDERVWEHVWQTYLAATAPQEKRRLLSALADTNELWLLSRLINYAQDTNKVRLQDFFLVLDSIGANPVGRPLVWNWVQSHWTMLEERFSSEKRYLGRLVLYIVGRFNTEFYLQEVIDFYDKYPSANIVNSRDKALETIRGNIAWMTNNEAVIIDWLNDQFESSERE